MYSNTVTRYILHLYMSDMAIYGIMVDASHGTQDISGKEQESIIIRPIDDYLQPIELFFGLYEIHCTLIGYRVSVLRLLECPY